MKEIGNLIDILAILPYYFSLVVEIAFMKISDAGESGEVTAFQMRHRTDTNDHTGFCPRNSDRRKLKSRQSGQRYRKSCISCAASNYQNFASVQNSQTRAS